MCIACVSKAKTGEIAAESKREHYCLHTQHVCARKQTCFFSASMYVFHNISGMNQRAGGCSELIRAGCVSVCVCAPVSCVLCSRSGTGRPREISLSLTATHSFLIFEVREASGCHTLRMSWGLSSVVGQHNKDDFRALKITE